MFIPIILYLLLVNSSFSQENTTIDNTNTTSSESSEVKAVENQTENKTTELKEVKPVEKKVVEKKIKTGSKNQKKKTKNKKNTEKNQNSTKILESKKGDLSSKKNWINEEIEINTDGLYKKGDLKEVITPTQKGVDKKAFVLKSEKDKNVLYDFLKDYKKPLIIFIFIISFALYRFSVGKSSSRKRSNTGFGKFGKK